MSYNIDELYEKLFEAESAGKVSEADGLRMQIQEVWKTVSLEESIGEGEAPLSNEEEIHPTPLCESFLYEMREKPFAKNLRKIVEGEVLPDITVAKLLSSYVTHALIEMENKGEGAYYPLYIAEMAKLTARFLTGEETPHDIHSYLTKHFAAYFRSND
jgi:hypothetical protein